MGRPGAASEKKDERRYSFDFVVGHKMKRGQPVFTVRWSHPWNSAEYDSELITTNMNDQAGTLAEYMKKHGLSLKKKNQRKQRGKVAKKNVQKKEQKKKEVKKKPSWSWEEVPDDENGDNGEEKDQVEEEEEEELSLPDVNQRQPPSPIHSPLAAQVAQIVPVASSSPVQAAVAAMPHAPPAAPVAAVDGAQDIHAASQVNSALQDVLQAQADAFAVVAERFLMVDFVPPFLPPAANLVIPQINSPRRVDRMMAETACANSLPAPPAAPAAPANDDDDLIYLSDG
ncbi:hypothetical protein PRIPAC_97025 [Pristionchus pacificus]|uniref:Uncharacterized protein n=1 Tax=Pristionchus pacificus TaxID=54126 RepID=A0A454XTE3_PRIPA|nr:hypothetical protein PRIPAC_97025 [Pristionchus pacificus]|eukprot:PDM83961.1 hypothetical protein PRIPAC_34153 [Pristionchus pacificus]